MNIDIKDNSSIIIWLTNTDQTNPMTPQIISAVKNYYADTKTKVVIFNSGKEDLIDNTKRLLSQNRDLSVNKKRK